MYDRYAYFHHGTARGTTPSWLGFYKIRIQGLSRLWVAAVRRHRAHKPRETAAVPTQLKKDTPTYSPGSKHGSAQLRAVQHLRKLARAARGVSMPKRPSLVRTAPLKELLAMSGLSPGVTSLSGASVEALGSMGLADLLWALAGLGGVHYFQEEMDAVLEVSINYPFGPGRLEHAHAQDQNLWNDYGVQVLDFHQQDYTAEALVNVAWALADVTHWTPKIADLAEALKLRGGLKAISNFNLVPLLYSFAVLDYNPADLLADALPFHRVKKMKPHSLINMCWSLCVLEQMRCQLFDYLWKELGSRDVADMHMTPSMASQLCQIKMSVTDQGGNLPVCKTLERVFVEADRLWNPILSTSEFHMSAQHADMCRELRSMGMEYVVEDVSSGYAIDIAIPSLRIAVEIDGPFHFARNADRRLGQSVMKHRHLSNRGWRVFSVTGQDWASADSSKTALIDLRNLIAKQRSALQG